MKIVLNNQVFVHGYKVKETVTAFDAQLLSKAKIINAAVFKK